MAKRRCIGIDVYESDGFMMLSGSAKVLYTYFILRCDDEGVVINPKAAMVICNGSESDLRELVESGYVITLNGLYVIRHWHMQNKIPPSKHVESIYEEELSVLKLSNQKVYEPLSEKSSKTSENSSTNII